MTEAKGEFNVTKWDEKAYAELANGKLTRAEITADLVGDIRGSGRVTWLMCYRDDGTADYVGFLDIEATIDGRKGGFVVNTSGAFDGRKAAGPWAIVKGSGRGQLTGISGSGEFDSPLGGTTTFGLWYEIP